MLIEIPSITYGAHDAHALLSLEAARDAARTNYFQHSDPGGLLPAQKKAWNLEHFALQLLVQAAQIRLDAEVKMHELLMAEKSA